MKPSRSTAISSLNAPPDLVTAYRQAAQALAIKILSHI
jgi:hypothetical protein